MCVYAKSLVQGKDESRNQGCKIRAGMGSRCERASANLNIYVTASASEAVGGRWKRHYGHQCISCLTSGLTQTVYHHFHEILYATQIAVPKPTSFTPTSGPHATIVL